MVEQRSLTMVDMSHHRHDWSARDQIVLIVLLLSNGVLNFCRHIFRGESKLISHDVDGLSIETLVDRHHQANAHTGTDDLVHTHVHHRSEFRNSHKLRQLQHLALSCLCLHLLLHALSNSITLLTTIFGTFLILVLRGQTGQGLLHLTGYGLIVDLQGLHRTVLFLILTTLLLVTTILEVLITSLALVVLLVVLAIVLIGSSLDVHALFSATDTLTLFLLAIGATMQLGLLLLTLLLTLFLRLLLRTRALVQ